MIDCRGVFPNCLGEEGWFEYPTYHDIVVNFGSIEIESSDKDYQGCHYFLLKNNEKYGYLSITYGSCSGCDVLKGCSDYNQLQNLVNKLEVSIVWQDSFKDMEKWISQRDWESVIDWHTGAKHFLKEFKEYPLRFFK